MSRALSLVTLLAAGCGAGGDTPVVVTVASSGGALDIARLDCSASVNGVNHTFRVGEGPITIPPEKTFGISVPPSYSGRFDVSLQARDANDNLVGAAAGYVILQPGRRSDLALDLTRSLGDGGVGGPTCATVSNVLLCEDFESGAVDGRRWQTYTQGAGSSVVVAGDRRHGGAYALHAHTPAGQTMGGAAAALTSVLPEYSLPPNGFYVRFWLYLTQPADNADFVSAYHIPTIVRIQNFAGQLALHGEGSIPFEARSFFKIPVGQWTCLEWTFQQPPSDGGNAGEAQAWVNDMEVPMLHQTLLPRVTVDQLAVGVGNDPTDTNATDLWIDDVIVSDRRIYCPQ